ncbi:MAG: rhamnose ABC transporter substrate-binding protein [Oscillochloris sp.]|nr:rhamnose ABC transporter substrate-binding protein [Oscillochloris sp.]
MLFLMAMLTLLAACGGTSPAVPTSAAVASTAAGATPVPDASAPTLTAEPTFAAFSDMTYVFVPPSLGNFYFDSANKGAQEAAAELAVQVLYQGPDTNDAAIQSQLIYTLAAQKVAGIAIAANDVEALVPAAKKAMSTGIPVVSWQLPIAQYGRQVHINQADSVDIAAVQIKMADRLAGGEGQIAILGATATAVDQREWIGLMQEELKKPEYAQLELVDVVYGDDNDAKSYSETQALIRKYPDLKVIVVPTTIGITSASRAVQDAGLVGKVFITGLGFPNQMRGYLRSGIAPQFAFWSPIDLGYLTIYTVFSIHTGRIKGDPGEMFKAGRLGWYTIDRDGVVLLGKPIVFTNDNIDRFDF